jgi:hypothetical protein
LSEHELRDGMRSAVADEPPLAFDVDELMMTAEREVRRRRALVSVGLSTAVIAVAAVAVPVVLGMSRGESAQLPAATSPTASAGPSKSVAVPTPRPKATSYTSAQLTDLARQMEAHLRTRFPQVVAGAKEVTVQKFQGEAAGPLADGQNYLSGFVEYTLGHKSAIEVHLQTADAGREGLDENCATCTHQQQPDGTTVMVRNEDIQNGSRLVSVIHFRADGSVVRTTGYNYDPTSRTEAQPFDQIPVTVEQLTALATDPKLHI